MKKILLIGSTVADVIIKIPSLPKTAEDINVESQELSIGGCAFNASNTVRQLGIDHILFSPIGQGIYGDFVRNRLKDFRACSPIDNVEGHNGCCYCFVESGGERTFVCHHGAEYLFDRAWFDSIDSESIASIYVCGLEIEDKTGDTIIDFLEDIHEKNSEIKIFFAPGARIMSIPKKKMDRLLSLSPILHLNHAEIQSFTGESQIEDAMKILFEKTSNTLFVTDGHRGSYAFDGAESYHAPAKVVERVVDTIGAGDSHAGAILSAITVGIGLKRALLLANEVAALTVSTRGAVIPDDVFKSTIPRLEKVTIE